MHLGKRLNVRREVSCIEAALKDLANARTLSMTSSLHASHDLTRREERASILATSGGSPGMLVASQYQNITSSKGLWKFKPIPIIPKKMVWVGEGITWIVTQKLEIDIFLDCFHG